MMALKLERREKLGNIRHLPTKGPLLDFASNDYLGLARCQILKNRVLQECQNYPLGSTGSRLLTGNAPYAEMLEAHIASYHGFEASLLFNCGYMANLGLISEVATSEDTFFYDASVHASIKDGIQLSGVSAYPFRHNDVNHLEGRLKAIKKGQIFVTIESVYSTDGSLAPLKEISELCQRYQAKLIVDEAHAVGVLGPFGRGLVRSAVFAKIVTFGKALGCYGAAVLGDLQLKKYLCNFARNFIYTTALPPWALVCIKCAYEMLPTLEKERAYLGYLIGIFAQRLPHATPTPIQPIPCVGNADAKNLSDDLALHGFDVRPLLSPTVRRGKEIVRVCLHAFNKQEDVQALVDYLRGSVYVPSGLKRP
jgi:8-amino-7-oxononanoate synthase